MAYNRWGMKRIVLGSTKVITRNQALPSNTILLIFVTLTVVNLILCLAGPDYIAPSLPIFSRQIPTAPIGSINKSFWTSAARFGDISFALFPLVILFALKAPPFAFLATRFFTQLAWDKLIVLHRLVGWLIYGLTTMHVLLWTVQLAKDRYEGRAMFFAVWTSGRFVAGMIGYAALTGLMVFSHRSIRKNRFDVSRYHFPATSWEMT